MKSKFPKWLSLFFIGIVIFAAGMVTLPSLPVQARGSAAHYSTSPKSGYSTGGYSAPKSNTGHTYTGGDTGGGTSYSHSYSSNHFFFIPFFHSGGYSTGSSIFIGILKFIIFIVVVFLLIRWIRRNTRK
ncbi:MAG TPA: hypothetical protein DEP42_07305 [Ruminococcaceae bacterium]|nr:hypothetical protein [Oscillospiraceae bacterium]